MACVRSRLAIARADTGESTSGQQVEKKEHVETLIPEALKVGVVNPETLNHYTSKNDTLKATSYMVAEQRFTEQRFTERRFTDDCEDCYNDGRVEVAEQAAGFLRR